MTRARAAMTEPGTTPALRWMLYGAYGYTGKLVIEAALARGHRPVLGGRNARELAAVAEPHGLPSVAFGLDDDAAMDRALAGVDLVYHVAGPFTQTAGPMREACLRTRTHYVDVTGESPVTRDTLMLDARARQAGIALLPSSGVNSVPTDAIAAHVFAQLPGANRLEVAIDTVHQRSSGSLVSMLEVATLTGMVRRGGVIREEPAGRRTRRIRLPAGMRDAIALPLADIYTGWEATHIPDITAYVVQPRALAVAMRLAAPVTQRLFARAELRRRLQAEIRKRVAGPDAGTRDVDRTLAWAEVRNAAGEVRTGVLETLEGYTFTAAIAPRIVEALAARPLAGATTAVAAFGPELVLSLPRTRFIDA